MSGENEFLRLFPESVYISIENKEAITQLLMDEGVLRDDEVIDDLTIAGEGNMNVVLRAKTNQRSFIIKQSRPWVAKYPQISAPIERVNVEADFIQTTQKNEILRAYSPLIIHHLPAHFLMIMEDLGEASDYSNVYDGAKLTNQDVSTFSSYLESLHEMEVNSFSDNMEMRRLNHEHIFHLPFQKENGLTLDEIQEGLSEISKTVIENKELVERISELGKIYLSTDHRTLIHGDFYPASFLETKLGLKVIDAEFSFLGPREFDWAVLLAHLILSDQKKELVDHYIEHFSAHTAVKDQLVFAFAGTEILRRLLGVAQLPLNATLLEKKDWVDKACKWILS